jgi:hypothetical protein
VNDAVTLMPAEPLPPTQPPARPKIFVGKDGLRAGWSRLGHAGGVYGLIILFTLPGAYRGETPQRSIYLDAANQLRAANSLQLTPSRGV